MKGTIVVALVRLNENNKNYLFDSDYVLVDEGDEVVVQTCYGTKVGTVVAKALILKGSDTAVLINEMNERRLLRPVVVNVTKNMTYVKEPQGLMEEGDNS